jgi:glutamate synthase (ferredoxin)
MSHRGASGADENSGDGAGITLQIPYEFFKRESNVLNFDLPEEGCFAAGMVFMHKYDKFSTIQMDMFEKLVKEEGQKLLGWREVPVDNTIIGESARVAMPKIMQVFIEKNNNITDSMEFERKLYK